MAWGDVTDNITNGVAGLARSCKSKALTFREKSDCTIDSSEVDSSVSTKVASVDPTFGCDATFKTFYEGKNSNPNYYDWTETPPRQISKKAARANDRVAIKVYKIKDLEKPVVSGIFALKYHMIEIQSPTLVAALQGIMKKEDIHLEPSEIATFKHPFRPLWFRWDEIASLYGKTTEVGLKSHLNLLLKLLGEIFGGVKAHLNNLQSSGLITFKYSWMYFPKDSLIYSPDKDCERICKVVNTEIITDQRCKKHLIVSAQEIAFDGEIFAWKDTTLDIPAFEGNQPITELDHYPLSFADDPDSIKVRLAARGSKVLQYQGLTYCEYQGLGLFTEEAAHIRDEKHNVFGRILIDIYGYQKHHQALKRTSGKDNESKKKRGRAAQPQSAALIEIDGIQYPAPIMDTTTVVNVQDGKKDDYYIKRLSDEEQKKNRDEMMDRPDDLIFLSPMLQGYALKNKLWLNFYVEDIKPITWNDGAYDHLVYDEKQKDLVLSFVENHKRTKNGVDDVIMGKGQGLILLLSGPPGTGKTLTAEAVADKTRRPLYYLQAEDLGINAALLGANIKKVFEMATEWDAVILLDEADVFMAERNPNDIARNELVSIFLRELEYFRGIIFLTTNLYETIDTAFRSRVNIHLLFNPLPPASRLVLWQKFIERLPPSMIAGEEKKPSEGLDDDDLKELAKWELNGREIKNAIKTVKSWCDVKGYEIDLLRLESGIKVTAPQAKKTEVGSENSLYD